VGLREELRNACSEWNPSCDCPARVEIPLRLWDQEVVFLLENELIVSNLGYSERLNQHKIILENEPTDHAALFIAVSPEPE
jgi:hypothetical protein